MGRGTPIGRSRRITADDGASLALEGILCRESQIFANFACHSLLWYSTAARVEYQRYYGRDCLGYHATALLLGGPRLIRAMVAAGSSGAPKLSQTESGQPPPSGCLEEFAEFRHSADHQLPSKAGQPSHTGKKPVIQARRLFEKNAASQLSRV